MFGWAECQGGGWSAVVSLFWWAVKQRSAKSAETKSSVSHQHSNTVAEWPKGTDMIMLLCSGVKSKEKFEPSPPCLAGLHRHARPV